MSCTENDTRKDLFPIPWIRRARDGAINIHVSFRARFSRARPVPAKRTVPPAGEARVEWRQRSVPARVSMATPADGARSQARLAYASGSHLQGWFRKRCDRGRRASRKQQNARRTQARRTVGSIVDTGISTPRAESMWTTLLQFATKMQPRGEDTDPAEASLGCRYCHAVARFRTVMYKSDEIAEDLRGCSTNFKRPASARVVSGVRHPGKTRCE